MNAWDRPRTKARIALGMCPDCPEGEAAPGGKRCAKCRDSQNAHRRAAWAQGKAEHIRTARKPKQRDNARAKRAARVAKGNCIGCGAKVTRFQRCPKCRRSGAEAKRRHMLKSKLAAGPL